MQLQAQVKLGIRVSGNGHYLMTEDGQPFFWLGNTGYMMMARLDRPGIDKYLTSIASKGFNVVVAACLTELDSPDKPNSYGFTALIDDDVTKPNIKPGNNDDYWDNVDYAIDKASELGIYVCFIPNWANYVDGSGGSVTGKHPPLIFSGNAYRWGHFLGDRYKERKNIIWCMGGDHDPGSGLAVWRKIVEGITDGSNGVNTEDGYADGSRIMITWHPPGPHSSSEWVNNEAWLDFNMTQTGHFMINDTRLYSFIQGYWGLNPTKPIFCGEYSYEDHPINWNWQNGSFNDYDIRKGAYWSVFAGGFGITYGCNDIWCMNQPGLGSWTKPKLNWYDALDLPGAFNMIHLKNLMLSRPFFSRLPDQNLIEGGTVDGGNHMQSTKDSSGSFAMIYFPRETLSKKILASQLSGAKINAWWFNPRDGKCYDQSGLLTYIPFESFEKANKEFDPPGSDANLDWVLVLDDASKGYKIPGQLNSVQKK